MNMNMEMDPNGNHKEVEFREPKLFKYLFILSHIIGITAIVLTGVWSAKFYNGFGFENPFQEFNFHPVFMVAMTYLCGNAMLMYRALRYRPRMTVKWLHTVFHGLSILTAGFALFAVIDFHNRANFANFYSLHSWMGIFCCVFYAVEFILSFMVYMLPCAPTSARKLIMPMHIFGGILVFVLLIASCLTGFTEKIMFRNTKDWSMRQPIGLYVNLIGVLLMSYGALVGLMVYVTEFKN